MPEIPASDAGQSAPAQPPPENPPAQSQAPPSNPPPAASVVLNGGRTEREVELETELKAEQNMRKDREVRIAHLEDQNRQLRDVTRPAPKAEEERDWKLPWE